MKNDHAAHQKAAHSPTCSRIATTHTKSVPRRADINFALSKQPVDLRQVSTPRQTSLSIPRQMGLASPRLASPSVVASPRIAQTPNAVSHRVAQSTSQRTRSIENLTAVAAAHSSSVHPFQPEDVSPVDCETNIAGFIAPCWNVDGCFHVLIDCRERKHFVNAKAMSLNNGR